MILFLLPALAYLIAFVLFYIVIKTPCLRKQVFNRIDKTLNESFESFVNQPNKSQSGTNFRRYTQVVKYLICDYQNMVWFNDKRKNPIKDSTTNDNETRNQKRLERVFYIMFNKEIPKPNTDSLHAPKSSTEVKDESTPTAKNRLTEAKRYSCSIAHVDFVFNHSDFTRAWQMRGVSALAML
jgi:hypothetical protein